MKDLIFNFCLLNQRGQFLNINRKYLANSIGGEKMIYRIASGKLKAGKFHDFVDWFTSEEKINKLKESMPEGTKYIGTRIVDMGQADHDFEFWYELPNYGALDTWDTSNPKVKTYFEELVSSLGFFTEGFKVKFLKDIHDVVLIDRGVVEAAMKKEKES